MKSKGTRTVQLADIQTNLFVRKELDQDWALQLAELIESGQEMKDLIEVTEENGSLEMVDGRHRKWGYELNKIEEVKVKVLEFESQAELIAYAYNANKGSKPPSASDTEHTIREIGKLGTGIKKIADMLQLPVKLIQKYLEDIKAKDKRSALRRGEELVREQNFTISNAAQEVGVRPEELRGFLGGHRRRKGDLADVQRSLTQLYRSVGAKNTRMIKKLLSQFEVGEFSKKQVNDVFDQLERLQKQSGKVVADARTRFNAMSNSNSEEPKESA